MLDLRRVFIYLTSTKCFHSLPVNCLSHTHSGTDTGSNRTHENSTLVQVLSKIQCPDLRPFLFHSAASWALAVQAHPALSIHPTLHRGGQATCCFLSPARALLCCLSSERSETHLSGRMLSASVSSHTSGSNYGAGPLPTCANAERRELPVFMQSLCVSALQERTHNPGGKDRAAPRAMNAQMPVSEAVTRVLWLDNLCYAYEHAIIFIRFRQLNVYNCVNRYFELRITTLFNTQYLRRAYICQGTETQIKVDEHFHGTYRGNWTLKRCDENQKSGKKIKQNWGTTVARI